MASGETSSTFSSREPAPPCWDGQDPTMQFPVYEKNVQLWLFETEVESKKRGVRLLRNLSGSARAVADSLSFEEIACEKGVENLMDALKTHYAPHLEMSLPRAFERAVYGMPRTSKETMQEYLIRTERAFVLLQKEGLKLDDIAQGYVAYRQASLNEHQDLKFCTWSKGQFDWKTVVSCLRKLDKVVPTKATGAFLHEDVVEDEEFEPIEEVFVQDQEDEVDDEQYILVEEGDLDRIYEESEAQLALATYQEVRRAINAQQKNRQYFGGGRARGPGAKGQGRGFGGRRRVHVEELKLRTKCGRCGAIGHWAKECQNPPDQRGLQKMASAANGPKSSASSSIASSKASGAPSQQSWYVANGEPQGISTESSINVCFGFSCRGSTQLEPERHEIEVGKSQDDVREMANLSSGCDQNVASFAFCKSLDLPVRPTQLAYFVGLTTNPAYAVVDTAAQDGLIGRDALERLKVQLAAQGLQWVWTGKQARAHGVGGAAKVVGIAAIPVGIGGSSGVLEATVVEGEVPLLLPIRMLRQLRAVIDLPELCIHFRALQLTLPLEVLPSGHVSIEIVNFGERGFQFKQVEGMKFQESDFRLRSGPDSSSVMLAQRPHSFIGHGTSSLTAAAPPRCLAAIGSSVARGHGPKFEESLEALATTSRQSMASPTASWIRGVGAIMASTGVGGSGILSSVLGAVGRAHQNCRQVACYEEQNDTSDGVRHLPTFNGSTVSGQQPVCGMGDLHGLPQPLEPSNAGQESEGDQEDQGSSKGFEGGSDPPRSRAEATGRVGEKVEDRVYADESDREDSKVLEGGECHGSQGSVGRESEVAPDRAQADEEGVADPRADDVRVCEYGRRPRVSSGEGLSRCRDVPVCREKVESPRRDSQPGGTAEGNREGKPDSNAHGDRVGTDECRREGDQQRSDSFSKDSKGSRNFEEEINKSSAEEKTWVRLTGDDVAEQVQQLMQTSYFTVERIFLETFEGMYEVKKEELQSEGSCLVQIGSTTRFKVEDEVQEVEETALPKKVKTKLRRALQERAEVEEVLAVDVSEVFSPPRVTAEARRQKMKPGSAFDLVTGFDLRRKNDLAKMRKALHAEDPDLTVCCPPCGPFSQLQGLNYFKMPEEKVIGIVTEGLQHLRTAMTVCKSRYQRGKLFLFEHPRNSKAWEEPEVIAVQNLPGVYTCHLDMCRFGMRVDKELNRKPTTILVNSESIAKEISLQCEGGHVHEVLMRGKASKAAEYPRALCQAMLRGLRRHQRVLLPKPSEICNLMTTSQVFVEGDEAEEVEEEERGEEEEAVAVIEDEEDAVVEQARQIPERAVTAEDKVKLKRMHNNLGHPDKVSFVRMLKAGRVREEIIQWVAKEFTCPTCESNRLPKAPRTAVVPRCYAPGLALGIDVFYIPDETNRSTIPVLNVLDLGTNYQMVEVLDSKEPLHIWQKFWSTWARTFGLPQFISVDEGREFRGGLARLCADAGIVMFRAAARAPWQQGKVERHGGLMKTMVSKARDEMPLSSRSELQQLLQECEAAKNRFSNRSGFSPTQRQIGQWPRMPSSLLSDEAVDPALQAQGGQMDEFERSMEMRRLAQDAFMKLSSQEAAARAAKARPRIAQTYQSGDLVYVFRVLRKAKGLKHGDGARPTRQRARWIGPGKVLAVEGSVIWVNMLGELWRVAVEQVRLATSEEKIGVEIVAEECEEMMERLKRSSRRAGYRNIADQAWPKDEDVEEEEVEEERPARAAIADAVQQEGEERGDPRARLEQAVDVHQRQPRRASGATISEPEIEEGASDGAPADSSSSSSSTSVDAVEDQMVRSAQANQQLDGLPVPSYDAVRERMREANWRQSQARPYFAEFFFTGEAETEEECQEPKRDYWVFDEHKQVLQRHHVTWRKALFGPTNAEPSPLPLRAIRPKRITKRVLQDGTLEEMVDEWSLFTDKEERLSWWKGVTEFEIDMHYLAEAPDKKTPSPGFKKKRGEGEVFPHEIPAEEWPEWRKQDTEEFQKIVNSGALKVLSVEESQEVWRRLKREGKTNRVIPSRMVRRYKPGDGPGAPRSFKSRFCLRGDCDPDILSLSRFAPTVTTSNLQIVFQAAANKKFHGKVGDLKAAFTQSRPLLRSEGPLYCRSTHGSMPGLEEGQLAEVVLGCYGLVDAPRNWRLTLTTFIKEELKYRQSSLDPCTYLYFGEEKEEEDQSLQGVICVEVDDLLMFGGAAHEQKIERLQQRFTFGKMKDIGADGVDFNGRRLRQVGKDFLIDMQAFVEERLSEVKLSAARKKEKKEEITEEERSQVRSVCGALNWAGREGRPDAAAAASMFSSIMTSMKVEDVLELNKVVGQLKSDSTLALKIQPIDEADMRWGVVSDASWANAKNGKTQAGHLLVSFESKLLRGEKAVTNVLHWRSGKLQRTVGSTLAAETQSLARGVGDLLWLMVVYEELVNPRFHIREWRKYVGRRGYSAFSKYPDPEELGDALALVDAKSLYDLLVNETTGGTDRRNALDVQALREELAELKGQIRWIEHVEMPADCLTKKQGKFETLKKLLKEGVFGITEEAAALDARLNDRKEHGYNKR